MDMSFRWFGKDEDSVTLEQIRQIPGIKGVISALYDIPVGEAWPVYRIHQLKTEVEESGLALLGIESVNVHDSIKAGASDRDRYIGNYITTVKRLGDQGVSLICYNFMPVFDWLRSDLAQERQDGSTVMAYRQDIIDGINPEMMFSQMNADANGYLLPGWEPDKMEGLKALFDTYRGVDEQRLFENLVYFLKAVIPVCEEYGVNMAIHPDDPAWPIFGLPRIIHNRENIMRMLKAVDSKYNGLTFCTGSLGTSSDNDLSGMIKELGDRIHFVHIRNLKIHGKGHFEESAHLSSDGSFDMYAILKSLYDIGFNGVVRPDHGRAIWGEISRPGYGLYDRALGAMYLNGLWEALEKSHLRN
ncbi:MAG TPA: mannonate dehydratase [Ruminococcaceae bacterium]|nr:mannonate dehydratase [Oscillospiraceae bacterium]